MHTEQIQQIAKSSHQMKTAFCSLHLYGAQVAEHPTHCRGLIGGHDPLLLVWLMSAFQFMMQRFHTLMRTNEVQSNGSAPMHSGSCRMLYNWQ